MAKKCKKRKHNSQGKARHEASVMAIKHGVPYDYFLCNLCKKWHIGRTDKRKVADIKRGLLMKNVAVMGIDPGKTGAIAVICGEHIEIRDFVNTLNTLGAYKLVTALNRKFELKFAIIEKQWLRDKEHDNKSAEKIIRNSEMWETLLAINRIPYEKYAPATWRKNFIPKNLRTKKGYIKKAKTMWPEYEDLFSRHDRAEACLIAYRALLHVQSGMPVIKNNMLL